MSKNAELAIYGGLLTVGLGLGFGGGYFFGKKRYQAYAEIEIQQIKEGYQKIAAEKPPLEELAKDFKEAFDEDLEARKAAAEADLIAARSGYTPGMSREEFHSEDTRARLEFADLQAEENQRAAEQGREPRILDETGNSVNVFQVESDDSAFRVRDDGPYLVSIGDFGDPAIDKLSRMNLTYYAGDETLADEGDNVVDDINGVVGSKSLTFFGPHSRSEDPDILYVVNLSYGAAYEITRVEGSFGDIVHPGS